MTNFGMQFLSEMSVLGLLCFVPQDAPEPLPPPAHAVLFTDGVRAARLGVEKIGESQRGWVIAPIGVSADVLREAKPHLLAPVANFVDGDARVDLLRRADSSWALINDTHGGGTRLLELITMSQNPIDAAPMSDDDPERPLARHFTEVDVQDGDVTTNLVDLFAPRLLEQDGILYVIASSYDLAGDDKNEPITWIAPVPADGEKLTATRIALGADARVARLGDQWCCMVRTLTPEKTVDDPAPVSVYWSKDLRSWRLGLPLDVETPLLDFDLQSDLGALWVVGVASADQPQVKLWRLAAMDTPWESRPLDLALPYPGASLRLLSSLYGAPAPKVVVPGPDDTLRVVTLETK